MDLSQQVKVNKEIMRLIKSKYGVEFPGAYNTPESFYYERLEKEIAEAERYLELAK